MLSSLTHTAFTKKSLFANVLTLFKTNLDGVLMNACKVLILSLLLAPFLLLADDDHVAVGTRPMSEEAKAQAEEDKELAANEEAEQGASGFFYDWYPPVYVSSAHHQLVSVTILDNGKYAIQLEDGSQWKINSYDATKALNWRTSDPLTITQNNRWFASHDYRIINANARNAVEATLFRGPFEKGDYTRYIYAIDFERKQVFLTDNTQWAISYLDTFTFKDWALGDAVIIGTNSGWDADSEALLINVNMNNSARAKQF
jgi:hypothetical protein